MKPLTPPAPLSHRLPSRRESGEPAPLAGFPGSASRRRLRRAALQALALAVLALSVAAQEPTDVEDRWAEIDPDEDPFSAVDRTLLPSGFDGDELAAAGWLAFESGRYLRTRELAEEILRRDAESVPGHCLLGLVQHRAEGNLPVALYHFKRCRRLYEERFGAEPGDDAPWFWHALAVTEMAHTSGEMGRHEDKVRYLIERDELYEPQRPADRGWPLMRLRDYGAARAVVEEALALGDLEQETAARTVLCAIEAEQQLREESYRACLAAAEHDRRNGLRNPVPFTNAAEAALGMLEMDEAERLILDATERFIIPTVANPWLDLTLLYLSQGRASEALDAVRRMFAWRHRQPAFMDEQNRAETELTSAIFLIVAGHPLEAARITARALERPDRTGFTSSESEQMEAAAALVDRLANRAAAELLAEEASWAPWREALSARAASWQRSLRAWSSGRRAAALLADERILDATVRPYLAGSVEIPEWIEPEIVALAGPGVAREALRRARARETLAGAEGYFLAYETEIAFRRGRSQEAAALAGEALQALPQGEALLQARVAAIGAMAAQRRGERQRAMAFYDRAMQSDPGVIRRLGAALPARFEVSPGPIAERAAGYLRRSPRFDGAASGFTVRLAGMAGAGEACLLGLEGTVMACARVTPRAGEDGEDLARRLAKELHDAAFAPRLDLTQADIRSLDGSPTAGGGRASERLRNVLSEMVAEGAGGR